MHLVVNANKLYADDRAEAHFSHTFKHVSGLLREQMPKWQLYVWIKHMH